MIVAGIFEKLFKNLTLTYKEYKPNLIDFTDVTKPVQFHFGDSKELAKWIRGRNGKEKYPLIWYVIEPVNNSNAATIKANCSLILFTATKSDYYNNTRALINYTSILDKLTDSIVELIVNNGNIELVYNNYENVFTTFDIPNYGVDQDNSDFTRKEQKGEKSITIDVVDARRIEFQARFNKKCLI